MDGSSSECVPRGTPTFAVSLRTPSFGSFETLTFFERNSSKSQTNQLSWFDSEQGRLIPSERGENQKGLEVFIFQVVAPTFSTLSRPHEQIPP
jgi:hypothetical protein